MAYIIISSENFQRAEQWAHILGMAHKTETLHGLNRISEAVANNDNNLLILDEDLIDPEFLQIQSLLQLGLKILVVGRNWTDEKQLQALVMGCCGYCEMETTEQLLLKAANQLLTGDIWIPRHLIPRLIRILAQLNGNLTIKKHRENKHLNQKLALLSKRERDVADLIKTGESNKAIAARLNISERTVKAHLTSIFNKLEIPDRLHLALYLKEHTLPE